MDQQALDRSLLESKEHDELSAIADALGVRVGTRMKKADMVEAIVTAAGNGSAGALAAVLADVPAKPKKARTTRKKAGDAEAPAAAEVEAPAAEAEAPAVEAPEVEVPAAAAEVPVVEEAPAAARGNGSAAAPAETLFDTPTTRNGEHAAPAETPNKYRFAPLPEAAPVVEAPPAPTNGAAAAFAPAPVEVVAAPVAAPEVPIDRARPIEAPDTEAEALEPAPTSYHADHADDDDEGPDADGDADGDGDGDGAESGDQGGARNWDDPADRTGRRRRRRRGRDRDRGDELPRPGR